MKKIIYISIFIMLLGLSSNAYAQMRSNVTNILTEDNNLDGWIDAFDVYITNSIDDYPGGDTDWTVLNAAGINTDFIVGGSYALTIDSLNTGEFIGDDIFRCHISMPSNVGTGFIGDITLQYISNPSRRIWDIYDTYLETFTPQPVFDGASPLLYELNTFDERGRDDYVDKIKVYFTESLNPAWFPHGSYPPGTIFHFTDDIFVDAILEHAGFETTIFPNDTYVMDITNATTLNNGNSTIGYVPMLPRLNFTNTMAACPWALRDLFSNLAVYGGGPYITEAITKEVGADTYIDVTFSSSIDDLTVDFSDFEVVLDGVGQTILSIAVAGPVLTLEVANIPPFLSGINRLRLTSTYCIADILGDENIVITWVNIKDGISPSVLSLMPSDFLITDVDVGTDFTLTIDYNEDMDTGTDPTITFPVEDPTTTITFNYGTWSDADTYIAHYDVADAGVDIDDIDITVDDAEDVAGNTQYLYNETDVFSIATKNPEVTNLTPNPALITDADVGTNTFTLTVDYDEAMDTGTNPTITFPVEDPLNTITFNYDEWLDADTYVAHYDVADVGETVPDIDVHIEGAIDDPGENTQDPYDEADVFSIDTENPFVTNLTPDPALITDPVRGIFTLTVDYSEAMYTGTDPTITFPVEDPTNTITFNYGAWSDADTYVAYYDVADVDETIWDIDVCIDGAEDYPAGNPQIPYCEDDVFSIDTENPEVVSLTPFPVLITDSDVGTNTFTLTVEYSGTMDTGTDPTITFPVEDPTNTITFNYGAWSDADTYVAYYDVVDVGETVPDIDVHIAGALDDPAGNTQVPYDEADVFSIDTENPTVTTLTVDTDPVYQGDLTQCVEVTYGEQMGSTSPVITFEHGTWTTVGDGAWSGGNVWTECFILTDNDEVFEDVETSVDGAMDTAGNDQVPYTETTNVFDINTEGPEVTDLTPYPALITDADVGPNNFTLTVYYDKRMNTGTNPDITFPVEDPLNTIEFNHGEWEGDWSSRDECYYYDTYVAYYNVHDTIPPPPGGETVPDVDVHIEGAIAYYSGNVQEPYDEMDVFSIDTENPTVTTLTVDTDPVYEGDLTQFVTVTYSEPMMGAPIPDITFEHGTWTTVGDGAWSGGNVWTETFTLTDNDEEFADVETSVDGAKDSNGNDQVPYTETTNVFDIDTNTPTVTTNLTVDTDPVYDDDLTQCVEVTYSEPMMGVPIPIITFEHGTWTTVGDGAWSGGNVWTECFTLTDNDEEFADVETSVSGAKDAAGNDQVPYTETTNVFVIDTVKPISSVLTAIYNSTTGCIDVAWEASDTNGIEQVELYVKKDGVGSFILADTDITGNTTGTFNYCLDPNPVCEEGTYEFYTIATDVPGNVETDLDPIVPVVVDIIASGFIITTTPHSPELGTYFDVNVAAVDDAGMLDCEYSNIIHFLSNYPDDVTLPDEPLLSNGYQVYGNCIAFETMDDLVIEAYGIYPFENYSYSDPIVIQPPTITPPTNTAAYDVPGDEGGWIYIDYELSLNDPFHSATEMPSINYYVVETNTDTTSTEVFNVYIQCDNYSDETYWEVVEDGVGVIYSGGPYSTPGQVVDVDCILTPGDYTFTIYDAYGDGICCSWGDGYYTLTLDGVVIMTGGDFGYVEATSFTVTGDDESWQAVAEVYLYDPPVGDDASVILQVPNGFVEYEYRMAAVYNQGYQSSDGGDALESQISDQRDQREGPLVVYLENPGTRDLCWQSDWAYCGAAAGAPQGIDAPVITNIYIESGNVYIEWGAVDGATSYTVYSDTDPYGSFTTVEEAGITDSSWNEPVVENKFYRVTASN